MAKKPTKTPIEKKDFDLEDFKKSQGLSFTVKEKELAWIPLSEAFHDAVKVPGIPIGYFTSFRGYSNTGKSTAIYEGVAGCQKLGVLPVIYETEGNWNWNHAKNIGVEFEEYVDEEDVLGRAFNASINVSDQGGLTFGKRVQVKNIILQIGCSFQRNELGP